jgi:hypothetical protein
MTTVTVDDVRDFAERVERLCEFFLDGLNKDGSADVVALQKMREDAADLQKITRNSNVSIDGLDAHLRGIAPPSK